MRVYCFLREKGHIDSLLLYYVSRALRLIDFKEKRYSREFWCDGLIGPLLVRLAGPVIHATLFALLTVVCTEV